MKLFTRLVALSFSVLPGVFAPSATLCQSCSASSIVGIWQGYATIRETQQVPITIRILSSGSALKAEFLNGPAEYPDATPASSVTFDGTHLIASFDYFGVRQCTGYRFRPCLQFKSSEVGNGLAF
jgi:hypothetical protein